MKRKIIKQGNGTLTITLPKKWTEEIGLKGGDEIDVEVIGKNVLIKSQGIKTEKRIEITLESNNEVYIRQIIRNLYLSGFNEIYIRFFDSSSIKYITKVVDNLLGYQIIEQSKQSCLIENLSPVVEAQFSTLLRKIFLLNKNMFEILLGDLKENRLKHIETIKDISKNISRFGNYCRRTIIIKPLFNDLESTKMYMLITRLITISHSILYIYDQLSDKKKIYIKKECIDFVKKVYDSYQLFYNLFYERKQKDVYRLSSLKENILDNEMPNLIKSNNENNIIVHYAAQIIRDIYRNAGILFTLKKEKV